MLYVCCFFEGGHECNVLNATETEISFTISEQLPVGEYHALRVRFRGSGRALIQVVSANFERNRPLHCGCFSLYGWCNTHLYDIQLSPSCQGRDCNLMYYHGK